MTKKSNFKIAYVADGYAYKNSGVLRKITQTVNVWREFGHDVQLYMISPPPETGDGLRVSDAKVFHPGLFNLVPPSLRYKAKYLNKILSAPSLAKALREFAPDVVYFRQTVWFPGLLQSLQEAAAHLVVEVNTLDVNEYRLRGGLEGFVHLQTRHWLLRKASGIVAVTNEMAESLKGFNCPVAAVSNGFDVQAVSPRPVPQNSRIQLVFVGSPGFAWHGVDKIEELAEGLPEMDFHLVGSQLTSNLSNVINHGYMQHSDLEKLYQSMDVGIGSLALSRNEMREGSTLKVREYLAYGLPVIITHVDMDVHDSPFVLSLDEDMELTAKLRAIKEYVHTWKGRSIRREDVIQRIDFHVKEKCRLDFFRTIMTRQ